MKYDPERHHRRSIRLKSYDYTEAGAYFVTICTQDRACMFGEAVGGEMRFNTYGAAVLEVWQDLPNHYPNVVLDAFAVMPNHVHGIIVLTTGNAPVGAGFKPAPTEPTPTKPAPTEPTPTKPAPTKPAPTKPAPIGHGLPEIIRAFKTFSARRINALRKSPGLSVWQRNYYEHIIRNEESLNRIRQYILDNPLRWAMDRENPAAIAPEPEEAWRA